MCPECEWIAAAAAAAAAHTSTPLGCLELIKRASGGGLAGKHVVILGRSNIVGLPAAIMGLHADATVTCCHSHTQNLPETVRQADILIAAIGNPKRFV